VRVELIDCRWVVTNEDHVAPGFERGLCALGDGSGRTGTFHAEIIAENEAIEAELFPKYALQPHR
jgi:hypothetical protein